MEIKHKQEKYILKLDEYFQARKFEELSRTPGPFYMIKDGFLMDNTHKIIHARTPSEMCSYLSLRKVSQSRVIWIDGPLSKQVRHLLAVRLNNTRKK
jgi:hypothetical protein